MKLLGIDTETTGVDLHHGAQPFLVTLATEELENIWYEWDVEPTARKVQVVLEDVEELLHYIEEADTLILQNAKFDVTGLLPILRQVAPTFEWPWHKTRDTLMYGHLLASNHAKDLTSMAIEYLGTDITRYEEQLSQAVHACRTLIRRKNSPLHDWRIAKEGLPEMPSVRSGSNKRKEERAWKSDCWLPRAVWKWLLANELEELLPEEDCEVAEHSWSTVTSQYANVDSVTTVALYKAQLSEIRRRKLVPYANWRTSQLPVFHKMEERGVSISDTRLEELESKFLASTQASDRFCKNIAATYGYDLTLPSGAINNSLRDFLFDVMKLPVKKYTDSGNASFDKYAVEMYLLELSPVSKEYRFISRLTEKRAQDTALGFISSYKKFRRPSSVSNYSLLFPSINPTGTATLRGSSYNPNEQQISKREGTNLRYIFGPLPGREWWSLDAKNIELRIPAYESEEQELIDLFERPEDPPYYGSTHLLNFHTVYTDIWDEELRGLQASLVKEVGPKAAAQAYTAALAKVGPHCKKKFASTWYQYCKNGGFAVQYGAIDRSDTGEIGTADKAFHREGAHAKLKARFSKLEQLNQFWIDYASEHGYVETMPDKTIDPDRGYPMLCTRSEYGSILPTVPLNYHTQGTAMQWTCNAMLRCDKKLSEWERAAFIAWITMQIHDELVFDFPAGKGARPWLTNLSRVKELADLMAEGGRGIGIPTPVGIEYHSNNWAEGITLQ